MTTTHAKPGRKPNGRAELDALLKCSEAFDDARARSAKEKRPVEFITEERMTAIASASDTPPDLSPRLLWAWPDGTVTSPESLRQRMRNLKFRRAKHGEVMTGLNHPVTIHNDL